MDILAYPPATLLPFGNPRLVDGWKSVEWVERYHDAGSFSIKARLDSGVREAIPVGYCVSHVDSKELMVVESHVVESSADEDPILTISGRSLISLLENRIPLTRSFWPYPPDVPWASSYMDRDDFPEPVYAGRSYNAIQALIGNSLCDGWGNTDPHEAIPGVTVGFENDGIGLDGLLDLEVHTWITSEGKNAYDDLMKLLDMDNLGVRTNRLYMDLSDVQKVRFEIYPGYDRTSEVIFSYDNATVNSSSSLDTTNNYYNAVYVKMTKERYMLRLDGVVQTFGMGRRALYVEAPEIDEQYEDLYATINWPETEIKDAARAKALEVLGQHRKTHLEELDVERNSNRYIYREDYEVGDLVTVDLGYDGPSVRRVESQVEIEDEEGFTTYPTLASPRDNVWGYTSS